MNFNYMEITPEQINKFKETHKDCEGFSDYSDVQIIEMVEAELEEDKLVEDLARAFVYIAKLAIKDG